jgi:hypothetical protein
LEQIDRRSAVRSQYERIPGPYGQALYESDRYPEDFVQALSDSRYLFILAPH